jgi:hypothetical protein
MSSPTARSGLLRYRLQDLSPTCDQANFRTVTSEIERDRPSNPAARSRYNSDLILEATHPSDLTPILLV